MARVKWNRMLTPADVNMNDIQKVPPRNLQNFMPRGGYLRLPQMPHQQKNLTDSVNNQPPADAECVSNVQPGKSSREGTFDVTNPPGPAGDLGSMPSDSGRSPIGWSQAKQNLGRIDHAGRNQGNIQSNLSDLPSIWNRKYTAQN